MNERAIASVEVDARGRLLVRPESENASLYEYIYREANGLRWDRERHAICAHDASRWQHGELLTHIVFTVRDALGENLKVTAATAWVGVSPELERELLEVLSQGQPS